MKTGYILIVLIVIILIAGSVYTFMKKSQTEPDNFSLGTNLVEEQKNTVESTLEKNNQTQNTMQDNTQENTITTALMQTSMGDITLELSSTTPKTTENFIKLAREGFYDGTKFHRVIKGFMNQGGDPLSKDDSKKDFWGTGGPGYQFADEITATNKNDTYTISMANAGPNTNGSQFFINATNNNFLDSKHTVFGKVIVGKEVIEVINNVVTDERDRPLAPVVIKKIVIK